jgi:hypothetical protein
MEESSLCKKLTFTQVVGKKKNGRPKLRWMDDVLRDPKVVGALWEKAQDGEE